MFMRRVFYFLLRHDNKLKPNLNLLYEASLYAYDTKEKDRDFYNFVNTQVAQYKGVSILKPRRYKLSDKLIKFIRYGRKRKYYTPEYRTCKNRIHFVWISTLLIMVLVSYVISMSFDSSKVVGTLLADTTLIWMLVSIVYSYSIDFKGRKQVVYSPYVGKNILDTARIWNNTLGIDDIVDLSYTKDIPDLINTVLSLELQRRELYITGGKDDIRNHKTRFILHRGK